MANYLIQGRFTVISNGVHVSEKVLKVIIRADDKNHAFEVSREMVALDNDIVIPVEYTCEQIAGFSPSQGVLNVL